MTLTVVTIEESLFHKGITFCPTPSALDMGNAMTSLDKFHRSLRLVSFFDQEESPSLDPYPPPPPPPPTHPTPSPPPPHPHPHPHPTKPFPTRIFALCLPWNKEPPHPPPTAIKRLTNNPDLKVNPADKGSGIVLMNICDCVHEAYQQLKCTYFDEQFRHVRNAKVDDPISRHLYLDAHNGQITKIGVYILSFIIPTSNSNDALQMRLRVENPWIYKLRTSLPLGLNAMD